MLHKAARREAGVKLIALAREAIRAVDLSLAAEEGNAIGQESDHRNENDCHHPGPDRKPGDHSSRRNYVRNGQGHGRVSPEWKSNARGRGAARTCAAKREMVNIVAIFA